MESKDARIVDGDVSNGSALGLFFFDVPGCEDRAAVEHARK